MLYMLRHGATELNLDGHFRGWLDVPLAPEGEEQARQAADKIRNVGFSKIVSSDMLRAEQTSEILALELGIGEIEFEQNLRPWDVGDLAGQPKEGNQMLLDYLLEDRDARPPGDGETLNEFSERNSRVMARLIDEAESQDILVVAHTSNVVNAARELGFHGLPEKDEVAGPGEVVAISPREGYEYRKL